MNQQVLSPSNHRHSWLKDLSFLALGLFLFYAFWLGSYPLFSPEEGRYSEVAREMIVRHDYITPRVDGVAFLDKPILYYWLQAAAMHLFGVTEWAIRFFPMLLGISSILMVYTAGRRLYNRRTGLFAALLLAATPLYFAGAHYADLNLEVAAWISHALLSFLIAFQTKERSAVYFYFAGYLCTALAFLTKGLIGLAFPAMIAGSWIVILNRWFLLKKMHLFAGLLLFVAINLPWYVLVQQANPGFMHYFFVTQQVTRFLSAGEFNNKTPFWFYLPIIAIGFLPWTCFLFQACKQSIKNFFYQTTATAASDLFLLLWTAIILIFFSIPRSKTIGYILPIFPALALLVGHYLATNWDQKSPGFKRFCKVTFLFTCILLLTLLTQVSRFNDRTTKSLVATLQPLLHPQDEVISYFKYYQDLPLYLGQRITVVADWHAPDIARIDNWRRELWYGMPFQPTETWLIHEKEFWQRFKSPKRIFVFLNQNYFDQFKKQANAYYVISQNHDTFLLTNHALS